MALSAKCLWTDVNEIWDALCVAEDERIISNAQMERWANMASAFIERIINRPVIIRTIDEKHDGNGTKLLYVDKTPTVSLLRLRIWDCDFSGFEDVNVDQTPGPDKEVDFDAPSGRLCLLDTCPVSYFTVGKGNIEVCYRAGFDEGDLEVLKEAGIEMIAVRYNELGRNPREQIRTDTINTVSAFTKGDFDELPWMMQQAVLFYKKRKV